MAKQVTSWRSAPRTVYPQISLKLSTQNLLSVLPTCGSTALSVGLKGDLCMVARWSIISILVTRCGNVFVVASYSSLVNGDAFQLLTVKLVKLILSNILLCTQQETPLPGNMYLTKFVFV